MSLLTHSSLIETARSEAAGLEAGTRMLPAQGGATVDEDGTRLLETRTTEGGETMKHALLQFGAEDSPSGPYAHGPKRPRTRVRTPMKTNRSGSRESSRGGSRGSSSDPSH